MPVAETIRAMLAVGRWPLSIGRVVEVASQVAANPKKTPRLIECLWDDDPGIALRAVDALERLSRTRPEVLARWKAPLVDLLAEAQESKMRWNLALIVPRLALTLPECRRAAEILQSFLDARSSIVKTAALQGLFDLTRRDPSLLPMVWDLLRIRSRSGTPAMRARGRILLLRLESGAEKSARAKLGKAPRRKSTLRFDPS
jgi:hypothetical protein